MNAPEILIQNGLLFDGGGGPGRPVDVAISGGNVTHISAQPIPAGEHTQVIDASGRWVMPGFIDMHTHYDAELEVGPALFESVRHGVTSVVTGSCSLSLVVGDPTDLADMFCRVEAIPRSVVKPLLEQVKDWDSPSEYFDHLNGLPLGPNVSCFLGHSTIRAAAMGLERSLTQGVRPTKEEMGQQESWLNEALDVGYLGLSISTLPWDKMDGEAFRSRPMPSVFATWREYRRLIRQLRQRERILQAIPNISTKLNVPLFLWESAGIFRKPLKTTLVSMMDVRSDRLAFRLAGMLTRLFNRFLRADFQMQALPEVFDLWADGIDVVVFEEFEAGTAALHLQDEVSRNALLADPKYRKRFKRQWRRKWKPRAFHRNMAQAEVVECPDASLIGKSFAEIGAARGQDAIDAFLDLVIDHGNGLRWYTVMGNDRPEWLRWIVNHPDVLMGFSDAGAHLRNMAHYNFPLRLLKMVRDAEQAGQEFMSVGRAVQRLTSEIADWLGLDAGRLAEGKRADVVVVDPSQLNASLEAIHEDPVPGYANLSRLVRRNDDAVEAVIINGRVAARRGQPAAELGHQRGFGRVLQAGVAAPGTATAPTLELVGAS